MSNRFICLTIEGSLIGADVIDQIADGKAQGQKPADFNLDTRHLTDEITAAWADARAFWSSFQRQLARSNKNETGLTRDQWMIPLLRLLGYELSYNSKAAEVDGLTYSVSHRAGIGETAPPIHLVGWQQELDRRAESGRPRLSPHALVQEYLNRTKHLWGLIANGQGLRLLRDSQLIRRQSYIEFDLRRMMEEEKFADFALLYRLLHRTRLPSIAGEAEGCLLEQYHQQTIEQGGRVRERLREGVEQALKELANAFLRHPKNQRLRKQLSSRNFEAEDFYQQLLRLIYRLLFLMVAEERDLLKASADADTRAYRENYSVERLRRLLHVRAAASEHEDLWLGLQSLFKIFQDERLAEILNVSPLNGDLFDTGLTPLLTDTRLSNHGLLTALWPLAMYQPNARSTWQRINYAALDVEELGSVYESLLELHPVITPKHGRLLFDFSKGAENQKGNERKDTGSYYTPPELVHELIESTLVTVIQDQLSKAATKDQREQAMLSIKVCDPACGSGHFLLAAARKLALELARIRSGEEEPTPEERRQAMRAVIANCIYGVDKNPLAVDLCKVALWIEGNARGKPLAYIDHRIRCGDSLVGVLDLGILQEGIPDEAFEPVGNDRKDVARRVKASNTGQMILSFEPETELHTLAASQQKLLSLPEDRPAQVKVKQQVYTGLRKAENLLLTACNLWAAAFFVELNEENERDCSIPTTEALRGCLATPNTNSYARQVAVSNELENHLCFFHWPLEFPEVFEQGGFDVVLGNPPFLGGKKISNVYGNKYRHYLDSVYDPFINNADLCAAFYRRAFDLLGKGKVFAMVATNSIGQGDSRTSGLGYILSKGGAIKHAKRFIKWPGTANVEVNLVSVCKGKWEGKVKLDGQIVDYISSRLDKEPEAEPLPLAQNENKAFQGDILRGIGFVIDPMEAEQLLANNPRNADCVFPYLTGEDLNTDPEQKPSRHVICFRDWELERAHEYPELLAIIEERVKPERLKLGKPSDRNDRTHWWLFNSYRSRLRKVTARLNRVIVRSRVSELHSLAFVPKGIIYSEQTIVFGFDDDYHFALLQSNLHEQWVRRSASTMRTDLRYTPTDCFINFPFPQEPTDEAKVLAGNKGYAYHEQRRQVMLTRGIGLTKAYNHFHRPDCTDKEFRALRELHVQMDLAILACYDWKDLDPQHGFHQNERGLYRFTVSANARQEILRRLLELSHQMAKK